MNVTDYTNKKYITALYLRLSKDDGDKEESESISNQRKILRAFAKENKIIVYDEYIDDGYSGTNFDRPDFKRMMKDIENKKVNMVITKSLSRLGRDYIETGRLIEKFFPEHGIRYIAILDDVDTLLDSSTDFVALKNLMNDFYAKETSKNIKKTKNRKRKNDGFYYISQAPFGYKKIDVKGNIEIVEEQANLIRRIYKEFKEGKGTYQIAQMLNKEGILTPGLQMKLAVAVKNETDITKIWDCTQVRRILQNPVYIGTVVQNKTRKISYKSRKKIKTSQEEYLYMENHHQAIIDLETWEIVQKIFKNKEKQRISERDELLKPFLYCAHCHNHLSISHRKRHYKSGDKIDTYVICSTAIATKSNRICFRQYNTYHIVEEKIFNDIRETIKQYFLTFDDDKAFEVLIRNQKGREELDNKMEKINEEIAVINEKIQILYNDRLNKLIEETDFILFSEGLKTQREKILKIKRELEEELSEFDMHEIRRKIKDNMKETLKQLSKGAGFTKEILTQLIKRIEIDKDKNINIQYNFLELNCIGDNIQYEKTGS
ncbi:MAG: recombinase family protein [Clostridia bacterium]